MEINFRPTQCGTHQYYTNLSFIKDYDNDIEVIISTPEKVEEGCELIIPENGVIYNLIVEEILNAVPHTKREHPDAIKYTVRCKMI